MDDVVGAPVEAAVVRRHVAERVLVRDVALHRQEDLLVVLRVYLDLADPTWLRACKDGEVAVSGVAAALDGAVHVDDDGRAVALRVAGYAGSHVTEERLGDSVAKLPLSGGTDVLDIAHGEVVCCHHAPTVRVALHVELLVA